MKKKSKKSKKSQKPNNYAFIDSQNLNLGVNSQGWKLDWRKFRQYLRNKYHIEKAYLFIGHVPGNESLYTFLQESGYVLIFKPTLEYKDDDEIKVKGNVDAELVLHTMIHYKNYDQAVIVSGDGDFHCLIEYLEKNDKLLKVLAPNMKYSGLLRKFNQKNYIVRIDLLKKSLVLSKNKKTGIRGRSKP
ncbi:MAG: NYN domain-containing protein [Candidatus Pacebacteria bacterium]|jgi:uncharacterized LabA/DUF88 family protein|nr:NYN domain-containing protein [Candidatus Paceibacterota bacterium]MBT4004461.1 NYN domain-containing protein [Candidatus Paceibacterota bacterium]MBT4358573.1 NYN domain-containing protein [Candidatus Paceibacterota bacterium]MBT4680513.1 NYN domain-containing protein [Candidatus Paceibacterota bacterium]MBT6898742.1 NYN domain-containing protein [Candidatus Paceibacterota bacterium]